MDLKVQRSVGWTSVFDPGPAGFVWAPGVVRFCSFHTDPGIDWDSVLGVIWFWCESGNATLLVCTRGAGLSEGDSSALVMTKALLQDVQTGAERSEPAATHRIPHGSTGYGIVPPDSGS